MSLQTSLTFVGENKQPHERVGDCKNTKPAGVKGLKLSSGGNGLRCTEYGDERVSATISPLLPLY